MLTQWLTGDDRPVMACIAIGGMGKSALTWAWVQRDVLGRPLPGLPEESSKVTQQCAVPEKDRPQGVLWWSFYEAQASFPAFVAESLLYASDGKCDPRNTPSWQERVRLLLELLAQRRILLVLDGFERELRAYQGLAAAYQGDDVTQDPHQNYRACVHPLAGAFLQTAGSYALRGRILLTSRLFPRELEGMPGCRREELVALAPADAVAFYHAEGVNGTRAEIERACEPYGYHPLTLRLLAGMIVGDPEKRGDIAVAPEYRPVDELVPKQHHILQLSYDALGPP